MVVALCWRSVNARERTASERDWLRVNAHLRRRRYELGVRAADAYPQATRVAGTPLLATPSWLPSVPVPLDGIRLGFLPGVPLPRVTDVAARAPSLFPERPDGFPYRRHSDVIRELAAPAVFENRTTYRLTEADLTAGQPRLAFGMGRYFDGIDVGGAAAHEYAAADLGLLAGQDLRAAIGDPCDLAARPAVMAISTLTLRYDRAAGTASFPLHYRDPARVGHAGGMYQVIPVGVFQPSGEASWNVAGDFGLWRCMLREFAEELLGADEDHGSETLPIDYASWPFARRMTDALAEGRVRAWCLGLGTDPLTFAVDLLTVTLIDAPLYDDLFGGAVAGGAAKDSTVKDGTAKDGTVKDNAEGTVLPRHHFDAATVARLISGHPFQAAGAALLRLAVRHADTLLC